MILRSVLALLLAAGTTETAQATDCQRLTHDGQGYTICEVGIQDDLRLFLTAPDGMPFGSFDRIDAALASEGVRLGFAMNAGMYHPDRSPVGLYLDPGGEVARIVTAAGPGNFGMRPNGVFCIGPDSLAIVESRAFAETPPDCRYATQSGPMLMGRKRKGRAISGWLVVDKPAGITSTAVVNKVRWALDAQKAGPCRHARPCGDRRAGGGAGRGDQDRALHHRCAEMLPLHRAAGAGHHHRRRRGRGDRRKRRTPHRRRDRAALGASAARSSRCRRNSRP
jgi:hypothetical protein